MALPCRSFISQLKPSTGANIRLLLNLGEIDFKYLEHGKQGCLPKSSHHVLTPNTFVS